MKKFLCYDTNDAASGKINVSVNGVLKPNSTVPSTNGAANQYLVTDDKGEVRWEDRLTYEYTGWKDFVLDSSTTAGIEITGFTMPLVGDTVTVKVDGVESVETVTFLKVDAHRYIRYIGKSPLAITQGAPGWSIAWRSEDEQVFGIAKVPTTVSLPVTEQHKIDQKFIKDMYYDNLQSESFALCTSGYASFPDGRGYYDVPDEMWKLLLNENATIIDEVSGAVMMDRRVNESNGVVSYSTGDSSGVIGLDVSTIYKQAYLYDTSLPDATIGKERHTVTASIGDIKQIDQKFIPPQTVYVNATGGNDTDGDGTFFTNVTLDKTYDEISDLLSRGVDVKIIRENLILNCLSFNKEEGIIFLTYHPNQRATLACVIRSDNAAVVAVDNLADSFLPIDNNGELVTPLILKSGTPGSSKKFKITVDDSGAITATEV